MPSEQEEEKRPNAGDKLPGSGLWNHSRLKVPSELDSPEY